MNSSCSMQYPQTLHGALPIVRINFITIQLNRFHWTNSQYSIVLQLYSQEARLSGLQLQVSYCVMNMSFTPSVIMTRFICRTTCVDFFPLYTDNASIVNTVVLLLLGKQNVPIHLLFKRLLFITTAFKYIGNPWFFFVWFTFFSTLFSIFIYKIIYFSS